MSRTYSQIPSKEDDRKIHKLELQEKVGTPKHVFASYITIKCPDCFCILKAPKASPNKVWITQCKNHHCWRVSLEKGLDHPIIEKIPFTDPDYPRRNIRS